MGVHGLWELLAPVGHRVSNDNVRNKVLAVDVSIWLTQFVKAMRDAEGAQVQNSHLLGVFRRCVKLLYLSVKPVFVFDGATPALKRRTLSSRRAQREKHEAKLRRLAEKMLLNRIKRRNLDQVIAKKRKGELRKLSMASQKGHSLPKHSKSLPPDLKESEALSSEKTAYGGTMQLCQPSDQEFIGKKPTIIPDHTLPPDVPYGDNDIDDTEIRIPENVDDLDDEVLMELPTKLQAEVFKQVKLKQRARHREDMMLKRQDPSEFSKMQIEGFLRHTALNRKISRVRNVINSKSGMSQRIASDSGRHFILEEDSFMGTHRRMELSASDVACLEPTSPEANAGSDTRDLLANIRARKEAVLYRTAISKTQPPNKSMNERRHRESGTDWASKVLEGNGGLPLRVGMPGDRVIMCESQLSSRSDEDSENRLEEQRRLSGKLGDDVETNHIIPAGEASRAEGSASEDDEWEDGNQPMQYDFRSVFGKSPGRSDGKVSKPNTSEKEEHPNHFGRLSWEGISEKAKPDSHEANFGEQDEPLRKLRPGYETDETATIRRNQVTPNRTPSKDKADYQAVRHTVPPSSQSATVPRARKEKCSDESKSEVYKEGKSVSGVEKPGNGGNTGDPQRNTDAQLEDVSVLSRFDMEKRQLGAQAQTQATRPHPKHQDVKVAAVVDSKDVRYRERKRLNPRLDANTSLDSQDMRVHNICNDEESGDRGSTDSRERNLCGPAASNMPSTAEETPSDTEGAGRRALKCASPPQDDEQESFFAQLEGMQKELEVEAREIDRQRYLHRGGADSVANEMYEETRDLIKLFGIPYLEAPMEAEAQCAFLNKEKIVDGVLTEDSDAFLFGATTVYRQLFTEGRFAEAYEANDMQLSLGLDRDNLIRLAYLLGSDYTAGVRGVGIVNSMEILEAFPGSTGLEEFREWTKSVTVLDEEPDEDDMSGKNQEAVRRRFCWKHRNMKRNWIVREGFPNPVIFEAYVNPVVDSNRKRFSWGSVDFDGLAKFCWDKFGWEKGRFDSAVGPLRLQLKEQSGTTQTRIDEFFKPHRFAKIRSERLQSAVHGMAGDISKELMASNRRSRGMRNVNPLTQNAELDDQSEGFDNASGIT